MLRVTFIYSFYYETDFNPDERKVGLKCMFCFHLQNKVWNVTSTSCDFSGITAQHVEIYYGVRGVAEM